MRNVSWLLALPLILGACSGMTPTGNDGASPTPVASSSPIPSPSPSTLVENPHGVMLQGFNWESCNAGGTWYSTISADASDIKNTFEYVWFPPPADSDSKNGYLPRKLDVLDTPYGSEAQLKQAISDIGPAKAIADVVINHRVGTSNWGTFTNPSWDADYYSICSDDEGFKTSGSDMYGSSKRGAADTGEGYGSGRDLDHTNAKVQAGIVSWMDDRLKADGFVGWRYDFVKGYGGQYAGYYSAMTGAAFSVGEFWPTDGFDSSNSGVWRDELLSWVNATAESVNGVSGMKSRVFDFVLKGNLNYAFGWKTSTDSSNLNAHWDMSRLADANSIFRQAPASAVTFVDNHDTGSTQELWELDPGDLVPAYAFLLTHPGYPCVAWQHYFTGTGSQYQAAVTSSVNYRSSSPSTYTLRQHIDTLIALRKDLGIRYDSSLAVLASTSSTYAARITGDSGEIVVKIGGDSWSPAGTGYASNNPIYSGTNFAIWQKGVSGY